MKTIIIDSNRKYNYQEKIINNENYREFNYGIINIMAQTGTGKSYIMPKSFFIDKKNYKHSILFVPSTHQNLVSQHSEKLIEYFQTIQLGYIVIDVNLSTDIRIINELEKLKSDKTYSDLLKICSKFNIFAIYNEKECYLNTIATFIHNTKSVSILRDLSNYALYFDEAHNIQTQFGMVHAMNKYNYSKTHICNVLSAISKDEHLFSNFQTITSKNKVVFMSATLDDIIINEMLPFIDVVNILNIIIKHDRLESPNIKLHKLTEDISEVVSIALKCYYKREKCVIYTTCEKRLKEINRKLLEYNIKSYKWTCKIGKEFSLEKFKENLVCLLINKGTIGLDDRDIKHVIIDRKLDDIGSSCRDISKLLYHFSNLKIQICGRLRDDGNIYMVSKNNLPNTLYDAIAENYDIVSKHYLKYNIFSVLNTVRYNVNFINNYVRLFIFMYMTEWIDDTRTFILKFKKCLIVDDAKLIRKFSNLFKKSIINIDDRFIELLYKHNYWQLEAKLIKAFITTFLDTFDINDSKISETHMTNYYLFENSSVYKNIKLKPVLPYYGIRNTRTTGGGLARPNISIEQRHFGEKKLEECIKKLGLTGKSVFVISSRGEKKYTGEFMHSFAKKDLPDIERHLAKYALPMTDDAIDIMINHLDVDDNNRIIPWNNGITVNYELLCKYADQYERYLRPKHDIENILKLYNIAMGNI